MKNSLEKNVLDNVVEVPYKREVGAGKVIEMFPNYKRNPVATTELEHSHYNSLNFLSIADY